MTDLEIERFRLTKRQKIAWGVVLIVVLIWGGMASLLSSDVTPRPPQANTSNPFSERVTAEMAEGVTRLALEYGIRLDEDTLKRSIAESGAYEDASGWAYLSTFTSSSEDWANGLKQSLLDEGIDPREWLQGLADRLGS